MNKFGEDALVNSLKQVSLQRLRTLKMDMEKLATDSRITDETDFWNLIHFHGIELDDRLRGELRQTITDNRGINIETAMRTLKNAQRKTGRDSVEVLKHISDTSTKVAPENVGLVPIATTPVLNIEAIQATKTTRNYKLDKFRAKAAGIGKLKTVFKLGASVQHPEIKKADDVTVVMNKKSEEENVLKNVDVGSKDTNDKETSDKEKSKPLVSLEENENTKPKEEKTMNDAKVDEPAEENISSTKPTNNTTIVKLEHKNKPMKIQQDKAGHTKVQPNNEKNASVEEPEKHKNIVPIATPTQNVEGNIKLVPSNEPENTISTADNSIETLNVKDDDVVEHQHLQSCLNKELNTNTVTTTTNGKPDGEVSQQTGEDCCANPTNLECNKNRSVLDIVEIGDKERTEQQMENNILNSLCAHEDPPKEDDINTPTSPDSENIEQELICDEEKCRESFQAVGDNNEVVDEVKTPGSAEDEQHDVSQIDNKERNKTSQQILDDSIEGETITNIAETKQVVENPNDEVAKTDEIKLNPSEEDLGVSQAGGLKLGEESKPCDRSDVDSISTQSSLEDMVDLDDDMQDISNGQCEQVRVGEGFVELYPGKLFGKDEISIHARHTKSQLTMEWVYGCNVSHDQSLAVVEPNELVYYTGSIVILYNHQRKTQRHYCEHTGEITSIAVHPTAGQIGSAQTENKVWERSSSSNEDFSSGKTHIRIWDVITLETLHVIGVGTIRNNVQRMQFLNLPGYFVVLENNEQATLTVWDGGCMVTSMDTINAIKPNTDVAINEGQPEIEPPSSKSCTSAGIRSITASLTADGGFVTAGKQNILFWNVSNDFSAIDDNMEPTISGPVEGDFGKNFFRAEYLTCCQATTRFLNGSIVTGDSNGTLLVWSEENKVATKGFSHAHECHLSAVCVNNDGLIFTAGSRDRLVKAFNARKSKLECWGSIEIPTRAGSANALAFVDDYLFVATEYQFILSVHVNCSQRPVFKVVNDVSASQAKASTHRYGLRIPVAMSNLRNQSQLTTDESGTSTDSSWEELEAARGFESGVTCVGSMACMRVKHSRRKKVASSEVEQSKPCHPETQVSFTTMKESKRAGVGQYSYDRGKTPKQRKHYAWQKDKSRASILFESKHNSLPTTPRLWAHERILQKEKSKKEELTKRLCPPFASSNHVYHHHVFIEKNRICGDVIVTSSTNGWLFLLSSTERSVVGRCKLPTAGDVISLDCCSRRNLVVVGTDTGSVVVVRVNLNDFEIYPQTKYKCLRGGNPSIVSVKFSPSGRKIAVSVGYDVVILSVRRDSVSEFGRCVGHQNSNISGVDWSRKKHSNNYYLRSSSLLPSNCKVEYC
uniref:uncharacterized protein LOC108950220 isoform X2 n=1 Tax=Ciona intestinalis TaxID=7719 RepID=UPI00089DA7DC|nr:uncharacterized protein LOC108950220 isoform X2 [Ciona intestinalis]|eukprot:XP_018670848.1 uncharacterized protein LOC108950220 isoform X2 [Ciona intestinalis]